MSQTPQALQKFNILIIAQPGRLSYEAVLFAASLQASNPDFPGQLFVGVPGGEEWQGRSELAPDIQYLLESLGAEILPFTSHHFGPGYPYGNKIEGLMALPKGEPFVFFDTDTLIHGSFSQIKFDFSTPSASYAREGTWPKIELYGPGYAEIWRSLYDKFGLDYQSSLDLTQPDEHWERHLYFNAGWFFHTCPHEFGTRFLDYALQIRDHGPEAIVCQSLDPWLDQVALPLVIHSFGGTRPGPELDGLDGDVSCHWRVLPLMYAREGDALIHFLDEISAPNKIKKVLKQYEPIKRMIYQKRGLKVRALFDRDNLPPTEQPIRNKIKREGFWMR